MEGDFILTFEVSYALICTFEKMLQPDRKPIPHMKICLCSGVVERPITFAIIKSLNDGCDSDICFLI